MKLQDYDVTTKYVAKVTSSERLTPDDALAEVRDIAIEIESDDFRAMVGQNLGVLAPEQPELGQEHHFRLYSVADVPHTTDSGNQRLSICVRRCTYIDEFSGEAFRGVASNYLCDLHPGDSLTVTGPYGLAFALPNEPNATLILIGAGTGIAPFRAFVKHTYQHRPDFEGRIILFHGGETGLDLLYRNSEKDDFTLYYDRDTFEAINVLSNRPGWSAAIDWGSALQERSADLCHLLTDSATYTYVAGLQPIIDELDSALANVAGSNEKWDEWKSELIAEDRWIELVY